MIVMLALESHLFKAPMASRTSCVHVMKTASHFYLTALHKLDTSRAHESSLGTYASTPVKI